MTSKLKIGVFDSGVGGEAIAKKLRTKFPNAEIISVNDRANVPYGTRRRADIIKLTEIAIQPLIDAKCDAIVIACNTATTNAISNLRAKHPDIHFVGIEPMVKPASKMTRTGVIAVFATPSTLKSHRYKQLKSLWASGKTFIEPDCSNWASSIEHGGAHRLDVIPAVNDSLRWHADVIVLGCTHYHLLKDKITKLAGPKVKVLEPSDAIESRLGSLLNLTSTSELPR